MQPGEYIISIADNSQQPVATKLLVSYFVIIRSTTRINRIVRKYLRRNKYSYVIDYNTHQESKNQHSTLVANT